LPVDRSTYHYRSRRAGQAHLTERIREIAATRVRYGYRRIHVLLRRERSRVNAKRVYRLYLDDARRKCEAWRRDYNEGRPHSAIGNKAPIELIDRSAAYGPR
jgi:transposase InsO family protein